MKKILLFCAVLLMGFQAYGQIPPRYFELGIDADVGAANNYLGLLDVLNPEKTIKIDLNQFSVKNGLSFDADVDAKVFMNVQTRGKHKVGFGFYVGLDTTIYSNLPGAIMEFFSKGNASTQSFSDEIGAGASVFADLGLEAHAKFGKLTLGLSPAMFIPVVYAPKPSGKIMLDTANTINGEFSIETDVYTPISMEELRSSLDLDSFMDSFMENPWAVLDARGFDLSLTAEYEVLPQLDLGGSVGHIPLMPASLRYRMHDRIAYSFNRNGESLGILDMIDEDFDFESIFTEEALETSYDDNASYGVFRPLSFDVYLQYKPLKTKSIILKPNVGFSVLTIYEKTLFNFGLEGKLDWKNFLSLTIRSGLRERFWRHEAALMFNFRVVELNVDVGLQSQDFIGSFKIQGAKVAIGLRMGF
jgi:hypothetical protein